MLDGKTVPAVAIPSNRVKRSKVDIGILANQFYTPSRNPLKSGQAFKASSRCGDQTPAVMVAIPSNRVKRSKARSGVCAHRRRLSRNPLKSGQAFKAGQAGAKEGKMDGKSQSPQIGSSVQSRGLWGGLFFCPAGRNPLKSGQAFKGSHKCGGLCPPVNCLLYTSPSPRDS